MPSTGARLTITRACLALSCLLLPALSPVSASALDTGAITQGAIESGLHLSPAWQALLLYGPSGRSIIDSPGFFLSQRGRAEPGAELRATILALASGGEVACRFPARREWLMRRLGPGVLPEADCPELRDYMQKLSPYSATLVFPESHPNSPASMFGHTLIRMESEESPGLLSYAVSYAADMPDEPGLFYPVRGVFGGFRGRFSVLPYHEKLKEYTHMDTRDIWEYPLDLSPAEVRLMALHVWELKEAWADYYFFDDNCSYLLLFLIDAARQAEGQGGMAAEAGRKGLARKFPLWVIPSQTVRAMDKAGLLRDPAYRPSRVSRMRYMESMARGKALEAATAMAEASLIPTNLAPDSSLPDPSLLNPSLLNPSPSGPSLPEEQAALSLELAAEYAKQMAHENTLDRGEYKNRYLGILSARSRLKGLDASYTTPPPPASPVEGHEATRLSVGYGQLDGHGYALLKWRFAYHSLDDPAEGYVPGAGISLMDLELRHMNNSTVLESLKLLEISSLTPPGNFVKPLSWRLTLGAQRERVYPEAPIWSGLGAAGGGGIGSQVTERMPALLRYGLGTTFANTSTGWMAYALMGPSLKVGGALEDGYALGGYLLIGGLLRAGEAYGLMAEARAGYHSEGHAHNDSVLSVRQTLRLGQDMALMLDYKRQRLGKHYSGDWALLMNFYF